MPSAVLHGADSDLWVEVFLDLEYAALPGSAREESHDPVLLVCWSFEVMGSEELSTTRPKIFLWPPSPAKWMRCHGGTTCLT